MQRAAIIKPVTALHVAIGRLFPMSPSFPGTSVSTEIAALRHILLHPPEGDGEKWYKEVARVCQIYPPRVIHVSDMPSLG